MCIEYAILEYIQLYFVTQAYDGMGNIWFKLHIIQDVELILLVECIDT